MPARQAELMADVRADAAALTRNDTACIIYTSGTGGAPRGVMQHHGAILHNVAGPTRVIAEDFGWEDEVFLSFLPLSHAYEHSAGQFFPIGLGAQIYYSEGLEKLASNIEEVRPTMMVVVPRLFEVLRARILKQIQKQGKVANFLFERAMALGEKQLAGRAGMHRQADGLHPVEKPAPQDPGAFRRADQGDGLGRRAAQSRDRRVLPLARPHLAAGLWPDRGRADHRVQPAQRSA